MTEHFDLAIIGTGSGNSLVTPDFDDKRVAIIESGVFGGTCLNVGCIPTKMFVYAAEVADTIRHAGRFGVDGRVDAVRWRDIRDRVFTRIDPIAERGKNWRIVGPNTTAFLGRARFTGERELAVDLHDGTTAHLTADQVVIATGAHPHVPDLVRDSGVTFHTSDTVMRIDALPERMAIIGGGYIAVEMAHVFSALGVQVTVLVRGPQLLRQLDDDLSRRFTAIARDRWDVRTGVEVHGLESVGADGGARLDLGAGGSLETDLLLVATGRTPAPPASGSSSPGCATSPTVASWSTPSAARPPTGSGRSVTSARPTSSSTSPTPRRGPSPTTSSTRRTCATSRTTTCPRASSATPRSRASA